MPFRTCAAQHAGALVAASGAELVLLEEFAARGEKLIAAAEEPQQMGVLITSLREVNRKLRGRSCWSR